MVELGRPSRGIEIEEAGIEGKASKSRLRNRTRAVFDCGGKGQRESARAVSSCCKEYLASW
jgi:hypothetical protein